MYPASRLVERGARSAPLPRILALVAAFVLLLATLEIFYVLKPAAPHFANGGVVMPYCPWSLGGGKEPSSGGGAERPPRVIRQGCHLFVPDQRVALRAGIGVVALGIVGGLMVAASRRGRQESPAPA
jgi:hypothetical protein